MASKKILAFILLVISVASFYLYSAYQNQPEVLPFIPSPSSILLDLQSSLGEAHGLSEGTGSWKGGTANVTPLKGYSFEVSPKKIEIPKRDVNTFFVSKNFERVTENEYKKGEIYCVTEYKDGLTPRASIFCGNLDTK